MPIETEEKMAAKQHNSPLYEFPSSVAQLVAEIEKQPAPRTKPAPRNFARENFLRLRDIEARNKNNEKKLHTDSMQRSSKYKNVQSKLTATSNPSERTSQSSYRTVASDSKNENLHNLPSHDAQPSNCQSLVHKNKMARSKLSSNKDSNLVPSSNNLDRKKHDRVPTVGNDQPQTGASSSEVAKGREKLSNHPLGKLPKYLAERKKQWQEEEEKKKRLESEKSIPPGHTLVSEQERKETLAMLQKSHEEVMRKLATLPIRNDTFRIQKVKGDLERQLRKIEEGIEIFSRPKVLIKNDS